MKYMRFEEIVDSLVHLSEQQKLILLGILKGVTEKAVPVKKLAGLEDIRDTRFRDGLYCPHCSAVGKFKRNGSFKGRQRYFCYTCGRTFNDLTGTPVHRTHYLDKWPEYFKCMEQGFSIRQCAEIVGISVPTAFTWRHKILHALGNLQKQPLEGIVEADETYVLHSEKGKRNLTRKARRRGGKAKKRGISNEQVCILVARDRTKHTVSEAVKFGRLDSTTLDATLSASLKPGVILCTDEEPTFRKYCREQQLAHEKVNPGKKRYVTKEIYHIQNVNAYHERFKNFLRPFRGVATKYLNHYLSWHRFMEQTSMLKPTNRVSEMFVHSLMELMKLAGIQLPNYCDAQIMKMAG